MKDLSVKQNILKEIMDLMDAKEGEGLKAHPKFAAAKIEVKPESDEPELPVDGAELEEKLEVPEEEKAEGDELSDDDLQMLLEKFKDLK